jgi:TonB family protein
MITAIAVIVDVSVVMALALLVCRVLRRRPAALRHMILAASLGAAAFAPALEITVPQWDLPLLASAPAMSSAPTLVSQQPFALGAQTVPVVPAPRFTWTAAFVAIWATGAFVVLAGLLAGVMRLISMTRRCQPIRSAAWRGRMEALSIQNRLRRPVAVLECPDRALLLTWGAFQPRIIVPANAALWTSDRIDVVLTHEIAHIVRRDWALQILAELVRAVYWFNPLVWIACRQLRDESEQACDDAVLRRGLSPVDYASHLLAVARHLIADGRPWASAPAVADPSTLERRVAAMLKNSRNRQPLTRAAAAFTLAAMFAIAVPLAAITVTERRDSPIVNAPISSEMALAVSEHGRVEGLVAPAPTTLPAVVAVPTARPTPRVAAAVPATAAQQRPGSVSGTLRDTSGAMLPGVQLTLTDAVSGKGSSTVSDRNGAFTFGDVTPAMYRLEARLPGFSTLMLELTVGSGEDLQRSLMLRVGNLTETVTVTCAAAAAATPQRPSVVASEVRVAAPLLFTVMRTRTWSFEQAPAAQLPLRIGGQIAAPRQTKRVQPVCPSAPIGSGGAVVLEATLGPTGSITDVKVLRSAPGRPDLDQSATDAIRQWEYTPTLLNNVPVPVLMTVSVVFATQ